jgi:hypothetical protein
VKARKVKGLDAEGAFAFNARQIVGVRLGELCDLAPRALDPTKPKRLHDMRIAAKRLRYVLEISRPALGPGAGQGVRTTKALQELLGDIHDCDEMLARVREHARSLREAEVADLHRRAGRSPRDLDPALTSEASGVDRLRGLETLTVYLQARREVLFDRFTRDWARLEARDFAGALIDSIRTSEPAPPAPTARAGS